MPVTRRTFLAAGAIAPLLSSCASDLATYREEPFDQLAARLRVCAASYVALKADQPAPTVLVSPCSVQPPLDETSVFQAASLTKPLAAYVALKLVAEGKLDLSAPVSHYLPEGYVHQANPMAPPRLAHTDILPAASLAHIPVFTLLNHSSGLPNWSREPLSLAFQPGTRWQYSGEGFMLLQALICAVTGLDFERSVSRHAFVPLSMQHSRLRWTGDLQMQGVTGTSWLGNESQLTYTQPLAAASLYTTAADYARLMQALFTDKAMLTRTLSLPIVVETKLGLSWGLGWGIETAAHGPYLWQWGNNPGFRAFAMMSATTGDGFVLLTNSERGMPLAASLAQQLIPAEHGVFRFHMLG
ncbi:CubicO group peptidase (beta-lactamase class C family) [Chitinivorax tropicus]|uniref:CubicO group peptidase (Beta-lactamase class C family) n=1 Tax=Chitinivorax tropicus TaxID=714531 RepID=A0A840MLR8_9PROT|nr:serine hydrolase domain-containing protein [Chitinivorax tropicus]MBB5017847.1 CubicO group peptidase (beta-lactamase class C family) [Chitinivorax tropicus]